MWGWKPFEISSTLYIFLNQTHKGMPDTFICMFISFTLVFKFICSSRQIWRLKKDIFCKGKDVFLWFFKGKNWSWGEKARFCSTCSKISFRIVLGIWGREVGASTACVNCALLTYLLLDMQQDSSEHTFLTQAYRFVQEVKQIVVVNLRWETLQVLW